MINPSAGPQPAQPMQAVQASGPPVPKQPQFERPETSTFAFGERPVELNDAAVVIEPELPPSETSLRHDRWSLRRGKEFCKQKEVKALIESAKIDAQAAAFAAADMLAAAWEPAPEVIEKCVDTRRRDFLKAMFDTQEYKTLHKQTMLNDTASEIAATSFVKQYTVLVQQPEPEDDLEKDAQNYGAAQEAAKGARKEVNALNDAADALGIGTGDGQGNEADRKRIRDLYKRMRENQGLRKVFELAGRYRRLAQSLQASRPVHGADEVVGIELGNDLSRLVPSELSILDECEEEFFRRYTENALMVRELRSVKAEVAGPIVVAVDESGSMSGDRIHHAKAIVLAMCWVARHQKRWICIYSFSGGSGYNRVIIPDGQAKDDELVKWCDSFLDGGTDQTVPFQTIPKQWDEIGAPRGRTDHMIITDGEIHIDDSTTKSFNEWKRNEKVSSSAIVIGAEGSSLKHVCNKISSTRELGLEDEGVRQMLSI